MGEGGGVFILQSAIQMGGDDVVLELIQMVTIIGNNSP